MRTSGLQIADQQVIDFWSLLSQPSSYGNSSFILHLIITIGGWGGICIFNGEWNLQVGGYHEVSDLR